VYSIESDSASAAIAKKMVEVAGLSSVVTIIEGKVCDVIPKLKSVHYVTHVDFCFVDHWKDFYLSDVQLLEGSELLRPGSRIVADNILYPGRSSCSLHPALPSCLWWVTKFPLAQVPPSS
jgi:catechol O-methyltransferase